MRIVLTGSIAYDYLMRFPGRFRDHLIADQLDQISVSFLVEDMVRERGGVAANIAYSLALLGERPILMGTAGRDFGEYRAWLDEHGVDTSAVRIIPEVYTASFFANTDSENNQIGSFYTGAMAYSKGYTLAEALTEAPDLVVISPGDPTAMTKWPMNARHGYPSLDPSQQVIWLDGDFLRHGMTAAPADRQRLRVEMIAKKTGLTLQDLVRAGKTVMSHGNDGSHTTPAATLHGTRVPCRKVCDPTGVGDAYRAGLPGHRLASTGRSAGGSRRWRRHTWSSAARSHYTLAEFVALPHRLRGALDAWLKD